MDYFIFLELTPECVNTFPSPRPVVLDVDACFLPLPESHFLFFRLPSFLYKSHPTPIPVTVQAFSSDFGHFFRFHGGVEIKYRVQFWVRGDINSRRQSGQVNRKLRPPGDD